MSRSKVTRDKNALCTHNTPAVWTEWNSLVADNVAQAANAVTQSLHRDVFARMHAMGLAGYRWALPCSSSRFMVRYVIIVVCYIHKTALQSICTHYFSKCTFQTSKKIL